MNRGGRRWSTIPLVASNCVKLTGRTLTSESPRRHLISHPERIVFRTEQRLQKPGRWSIPQCWLLGCKGCIGRKVLWSGYNVQPILAQETRFIIRPLFIERRIKSRLKQRRLKRNHCPSTGLLLFFWASVEMSKCINFLKTTFHPEAQIQELEELFQRSKGNSKYISNKSF